MKELKKEIKALRSDMRAIKAMLAQQGPVEYNPPVAVKIAAARAQGMSVYELLESQKKLKKGKTL